jgi:hypothetical protein
MKKTSQRWVLVIYLFDTVLKWLYRAHKSDMRSAVSERAVVKVGQVRHRRVKDLISDEVETECIAKCIE